MTTLLLLLLLLLLILAVGNYFLCITATTGLEYGIGATVLFFTIIKNKIYKQFHSYLYKNKNKTLVLYPF